MSLILAIDLGSTSFKAAVVDRRLKVRGLGEARLEYHFARGGEAELEVEATWEVLRRAVRGALQAAGVQPESLRTATITSQAQTFTVLDRGGRAKTRFISWQDHRATTACSTLRRCRSLANFAAHCSFSEPLPALQISQLKHLRQAQPGFIKEDDLILKLPAYIVWRLTGIAVMDNNLAAMSGLYSLVYRDWWPSALRVCGLRREQLPHVIPAGGIARRTTYRARALGLPQGLPLVLAGNDQTSGAFGAQLHENHGLLVTLGTALVAYVCMRRMPRPHPAIVRGPYPGGLAYCLAASGSGGNVINWGQSILAGCGTDEEFFAQAARSERGARGLVFKLVRDGGAGTWHNVRRQHTVADFARSMLEGLAGQVAVMVRQLGGAASHRPVFAGGGGSRCPLFVQSPTCRSTESPTPCRARNPATCRSGGLPLAAPKSETSPNCLRALRP